MISMEKVNVFKSNISLYNTKRIISQVTISALTVYQRGGENQ